MTAQNKKLNVAEEVRRAAETLSAADLLKDHGHFNEAVSRLYYCLLYHVRALLLIKDVEPKSHEAALRLFSLHFVRPGAFPAADAHLFSRLMKYREEADYNPSYEFAGDDYDQLRAEATGFFERAIAHLRAQDLLDP